MSLVRGGGWLHRTGVAGKRRHRGSGGGGGGTRSFSTPPTHPSTPSSDIQGTLPRWGHGVHVGHYAQVERSFSALEIEAFGRLIHDTNILHVPNNDRPWKDVVTELPHLQAVHESGLIQFHPNDHDDPKQRIKPLVHGMFVSSLFSSILGTLSPGCVYLNQTLAFSKPVFAEDRIVARIEIEKIRRWRKGGLVLLCKTTVSFVAEEEDGNDQEDNSRIAITGTANVWLPSGHT